MLITNWIIRVDMFRDSKLIKNCWYHNEKPLEHEAQLEAIKEAIRVSKILYNFFVAYWECCTKAFGCKKWMMKFILIKISIKHKQQNFHILLSYSSCLCYFRRLLIYNVDGIIVLYKGILKNYNFINLSKLLIWIMGLSRDRKKLLSYIDH